MNNHGLRLKKETNDMRKEQQPTNNVDHTKEKELAHGKSALQRSKATTLGEKSSKTRALNTTYKNSKKKQKGKKIAKKAAKKAAKKGIFLKLIVLKKMILAGKKKHQKKQKSKRTSRKKSIKLLPKKLQLRTPITEDSALRTQRKQL